VADIARALIDELAIAPVIWIGYSWGASIGVHTALRAPGRVKALALLDGAYLTPEDDPEYDPTLDLEARTSALQEEIKDDDSWDAPVEVIAAAIKGSHEEPALPLLPALEGSGLPVILVHSTEPPEYEELRVRALARFRAALPSAEVALLPPDTTSSPTRAMTCAESCSTGWRGWTRPAPAPRARG